MQLGLVLRRELRVLKQQQLELKAGLRSYTDCIIQPLKGRALRRLRKAAGLTQAALAERLGVTPNTVARWERDEVGISEPMARLINLTLAPRTGKADKGGS